MQNARGVACALGIASFILLPQFYQASGTVKWGLPTVVGGDEPHYLVLLNSLILDGDFDLRNNYLSVHEGSNQAGANFAGSSVDHHSSYWIGDQRLIWIELFNPYVHAWPRDSGGHLIPQVRWGVDPAFAQKPEAPAHPVGVALLLAPVVFAFRGTEWVEHIAIFCSALATLLAAYFYRRILLHFSANESAVWTTIISTFLASPLLFYSRSFFNEPFITLLIIAAFAFALAPGQSLWAGVCLGLAVLMKPQNATLAIPLSLLFLQKRDFKSLVLFGLAPAIACLLTLWFNSELYGSPWLGPYPYYRGSLSVGAWGLLASERRGLLWFAPALLLSAFGWPGLLRRFRLEALVFLLGFVLLFVIAASSAYWDGGYCYGPRLITTAIPLFGIGLVHALERAPFNRLLPRFALYAVIFAGFLINLLAATQYASSWEMTPLAILQRHLHV
jgi:hypothetical protein